MLALAGIFLAFFLCASLPAAAGGDVARNVFVGGAEVALPVVEGFREVYGASPQFDAFARQIVPPENRLLAVYLLPEDAQAIAGGRQTEMKRYIIVQTPKGDVTIRTAEEFAAVKRQVLAEAGPETAPEAQQQADRISDFVNKTYGQNMRLELGETRSLGAFLDADNAIGVVMLANVGVQAGGQAKDIPIAAAMTAVQVKGKVLYAMVYAAYSGARDADFARAAGEAFARRALVINGGSAPQGASAGATEEYGAADDRLSVAMIVTGALCVIVLGFFIFAPLVRRMRGGRDETR